MDDLVEAFARFYSPISFNPKYTDPGSYDCKLALEAGQQRLNEVLKIIGDQWAIVPVEPSLEQQAAGYDVLKSIFPDEYKKDSPVGHYRVYEAMVRQGRIR